MHASHRTGTAGVVSRPSPDRFRVAAGTVMSLVAGRSAYRLITLVTTVALLPVWGAERYGVYAAATASLSWLMVLVFTGPEKTVLKLLPRAPRTGPLVTGGLLAVVWWLPVPVAAAFGLVLLAGGPERLAIYIGVAGMLLSVGCTQLLVGLHRVHGRPGTDVRSFLVMSVAEVGLLAGAVAGWLGPAGFIGLVTAVQLALNVALSVRLGRPSLRILRRRGFLRRLCLTALYLSSTELYLFLSSAVLFAVLAASAGHADEVGPLYAVLLVWSAGVNVMTYLLRVFAPGTSLRLAGRAATGGRARAARLAWFSVLAQVAWLAAVGVTATATGWLEAGTPTGEVLVWAVLLATKTPAIAVLLLASYLLENTDATAPRVVGRAAVVGLAVTGGAALLLVPAAGGVGVIASYSIGELAYALVVACGARRRG